MSLKEKILNVKNLWHLGAIILFFVIAAAYYAPALKGYTVDQGDVKNWAGMAQEIRDYRENSGENVLWTNSMFGGMPAVQISADYPGKDILHITRDVLTLWLPQPISIMFLYFVGFYFLALMLRMKPLIGMLGAVAYGLSSYFIVIVEAGHSTKGFALALAPFVIASFLYAYQRKNWILGVGLSALFMALEINANHLQITYYMAFVLLFLGLVEFYRAFKVKHLIGSALLIISYAVFMWVLFTLGILPIGLLVSLVVLILALNKGKWIEYDNTKFIRFLKATIGLGVAYGLAVLINIGNIAGTLEYTEFTTRGGTELEYGPDGTSLKIEEDGMVYYMTPDGQKLTEAQLIIPEAAASPAEATGGLDRDYITAWSYGRSETFSFIIPNFKGGKSIPIGANEDNEDALEVAGFQMKQNVAQSSQYWGDQPFTSGPVYIGIIVVFLAFLALMYNKEKWKWALLSVTLLTVFLSWGRNYVSVLVIIPALAFMGNMFIQSFRNRLFTSIMITFLMLVIIAQVGPEWGLPSLSDFFIYNIPGYNKFRAVSMILVMAELCIPLLAMLFIHKLWKSREEVKKNIIPFYVVTGIFFIILVAFMAAPESFNSFLTAQESMSLDSITDPNMRMQYDMYYGDLEATRIEIFRSDMQRTLGFFLLGAIAVFLIIRMKKEQNLGVMLSTGALILFILLDLVTVDLRYLNSEKNRKDYAQWIEMYKRRFPYSSGKAEQDILAYETLGNPDLQFKIDSAINKSIKDAKDLGYKGQAAARYTDWVTYRTLNRNTNFRVFDFNNPFNSSYASYFNKSIGGYHGAKLGKYQELIEWHIGKGNKGVMNMLNVKYQIQHQDDGFGGTSSQIININQSAMGNVWFAKNIQKVNSANEEILAMNSYESYMIEPTRVVPTFVNGVQIMEKTEVSASDRIEIAPIWVGDTIQADVPFQALATQNLTLFADSTGINWGYTEMMDSTILQIFRASYGGVSGWDPNETTLVDEQYSDVVTQEAYSGTGTIEMISYHPDRMVYKSNSTEKQLAVFSEIHYPIGWVASIDGQEQPKIARVNYMLRAIEVPAGEHTIELNFSLPSYERSGTMAWIATFLILGLIGGGLFLGTKKQFQEDESDEEEEEEKTENLDADIA